MVIQIDYKTINWLDCKLQSNIFASDLIIFIDFVDFFFQIYEGSNWCYRLFGHVRTGFYLDVQPIIIWIVRLETFWRPSNIKVSFSSSFIPFSSSEPDYSLISRKDFSQKSDQKPITYRLIKMIKENQATIIQIIPVIWKNSKYLKEMN